jgi:hypothetical protein
VLVISKFARTLAEALKTLADDLETASAAVPDARAVEEIAVPEGRGQRQRQILE